MGMGKASANMRSDRSKNDQDAASHGAANGARTVLRALVFGASVLVAAAGVASAQSAQRALNTPAAAMTTNALGPVARAQIEALVAEKAARTPAQQKIDSRVLL